MAAGPSGDLGGTSGRAACLALTAWIKYYPGLAVVAFLAFGRKKAVATFVAVVALVVVVDREGFVESIKSGRKIEGNAILRVGNFHPSSHSIQEYWRLNPIVHGSSILGRIPAPLPAALLLLPALWLVSRGVVRSKDAGTLTVPYLLWITATATFALPYANDYNLTPLPLAALAVWDRRDRWIVQVALALSLVWLQPAWLPISGSFLMIFKLGALYAVGACLVARASREGTRELTEGRVSVFRPAFARMNGARSRRLGSRRSGVTIRMNWFFGWLFG